MKAYLRLLKPNSEKLPPGHRLPTWKAYEPSSTDKDDAKKRSGPVRVSVWDRECTTIPQAKIMAGPAYEVARSFELTDAAVADVARSTSRPELKVVPDPLDELVGQPGADGHCGIEGCERPSGERGDVWKDRLQRLAERSRDVSDLPEE